MNGIKGVKEDWLKGMIPKRNWCSVNEVSLMKLTNGMGYAAAGNGHSAL